MMKSGFEKNTLEYSAEQAQKLINSPQAQQLLAILNKDGGKALQMASEAAAKGDYAAVQKLLSPQLQSKEAAKLMNELNRQR